MRQKFFLPIFFLVLFPSLLFAQQKYDFSQFWTETGHFFTQPLHWEGSDWLNLGVVGAASYLSSFADQPIRNIRNTINQNHPSYYSSPFIESGRIYGELYMPIARKIGYEVGQASLYGGSIVYLMKIIEGRSRPLTNEGNGTFHPFTFSFDDRHANPSGHVAVAMIISTILSRNADPLWLKILAYAPAALTPISRIYQDWHWTSDCVLGGLIGYFFATWVVDTHERNDAALHEKSDLQINSIFPLSISIAVK